MRLSKRGDEEDTYLDMTPMIDIIFQLIIFFLMFSSFVEEEDVLKIELPVADKANPISAENIAKIYIQAPKDNSDRYHYSISGTDLDTHFSDKDKKDPKFYSMDKLRPIVKEWWDTHKNKKIPPKVMLVVDRKAPYEAYVHTRNLMLDLNITNVFSKVKSHE